MLTAGGWKTSREWAHAMFGGNPAAPVNHGLVSSWLVILHDVGHADTDGTSFRAVEES